MAGWWLYKMCMYINIYINNTVTHCIIYGYSTCELRLVVDPLLWNVHIYGLGIIVTIPSGARKATMVSRCFKMFNGWFPDVPVSFHFDQPTDLSKGMNLEKLCVSWLRSFPFPAFLTLCNTFDNISIYIYSDVSPCFAIFPHFHDNLSDKSSRTKQIEICQKTYRHVNVRHARAQKPIDVGHFWQQEKCETHQFIPRKKWSLLCSHNCSV